MTLPPDCVKRECADAVLNVAGPVSAPKVGLGVVEVAITAGVNEVGAVADATPGEPVGAGFVIGLPVVTPVEPVTTGVVGTAVADCDRVGVVTDWQAPRAKSAAEVASRVLRFLVRMSRPIIIASYVIPIMCRGYEMALADDRLKPPYRAAKNNPFSCAMMRGLGPLSQALGFAISAKDFQSLFRARFLNAQQSVGMKLFTIFGGSGFVGRYVVEALTARGHRVRVAVRNPNLALFLKPLGVLGQVQLVQANVRFPKSVAAAVEGADGVVNLVGLLAQSGAQRFDDVQLNGAVSIAEAAKASGISRLVQVSAIGADAQSSIDYARTKGAAEIAMRERVPTATVLRPSIIFGAEDGFFNRFGAMAGLPFLLMPVLPVICGDTKFQPVHVKDVASAIVAALESGDYAGQTYDLGGPTVYSFRQLLAYIKQETQSKKPLLEVPLPIAKVQAALLGLLPNPPLTSDQLAMLQSDNVCAAGRPGFEAFGISPTPLEVVVPQYLARYRPRGQFAPRHTG
jgi:uncharacterized protein YbjT (DUF2867 family)